MSVTVELSPVLSFEASLSGSPGALDISQPTAALEALLVPVLISGGVGEFITLSAGATIQARHVVRAEAGILLPIDTSIPSHAQQIVGISVGSALIGQQIVIQRFGIATESAWTWGNGVIYCGPSGQLTQAPSASGWLLQVARVISPTRIDIDIEQPIAR